MRETKQMKMIGERRSLGICRLVLLTILRAVVLLFIIIIAEPYAILRRTSTLETLRATALLTTTHRCNRHLHTRKRRAPSETHVHAGKHEQMQRIGHTTIHKCIYRYIQRSTNKANAHTEYSRTVDNTHRSHGHHRSSRTEHHVSDQDQIYQRHDKGEGRTLFSEQR